LLAFADLDLGRGQRRPGELNVDPDRDARRNLAARDAMAMALCAWSVKRYASSPVKRAASFRGESLQVHASRVSEALAHAIVMCMKVGAVDMRKRG
jgi:hypothetical protein